MTQNPRDQNILLGIVSRPFNKIYIDSKNDPLTLDNYLQTNLDEKIPLNEQKIFLKIHDDKYDARPISEITADENELFGSQQKKHWSPRFALDFDKFYQYDLVHRANPVNFKVNTVIQQANNVQRKNFETYYKQEYITENYLNFEQNTKYSNEVENFNAKCKPLFFQTEENQYRSYMKKIQSVKGFYEKTDVLVKELKELRDKFINLESNIVYVDFHLRNRIVLQLFHHQLLTQKWKVRNDLRTNNEMNVSDQLSNKIDNQKQRQYSVWDIAKYFFKFLNSDSYNVDVIFPDVHSFVIGIMKLKRQSVTCLLELHYTLGVLSTIENNYYNFKKWSNKYIFNKRKSGEIGLKKKHDIKQRYTELRTKGIDCLGDKLTDAVSHKLHRTVSSLCDTMFAVVIPKSIKSNDDEQNEEISTIFKFGIITKLVTNILGELDKIPVQKLKQIEKKSRSHYLFIMRKAKRTHEIEIRNTKFIEKLKVNLRSIPSVLNQQRKQFLPPPAVKLKIFKKKITKSTEVSVSGKSIPDENNRIFSKAFIDNNDKLTAVFDQKEQQESLSLLQQSCIPFYFDHFLKLHDYYPSYDFKTQIELREGAESKRFKYEDVIEDVLHQTEVWERQRQKNIREHIRKTKFLYVDRD